MTARSLEHRSYPVISGFGVRVPDGALFPQVIPEGTGSVKGYAWSFWGLLHPAPGIKSLGAAQPALHHRSGSGWNRQFGRAIPSIAEVPTRGGDTVGSRARACSAGSRT